MSERTQDPPARPQGRQIDAKTLADALSRFRHDPDLDAFFHGIGTPGRNRLLLLQQALSAAETQADRDTLEDIGFALSGRVRLPGAAALNTVEARARDSYGKEIADILNVREAASGLIRASDTQPPENAIVAAVGLAAERKLRNTWSIGRQDGGKTASLYTANCGECGGDDGGQGYVLCAHCLREAERRVVLRSPPSSASEKRAVMRAVLIQQAESFGCAKCGHKPARDCGCRTELPIPPHPKDGQFVRARRVKTGATVLYCLRLKGHDG